MINFCLFEADQILDIPISIGRAEDELCWIQGVDGALRVKDVYSHLMNDVDFASCSKVLIPYGESFGNLKFLLRFEILCGVRVGIASLMV